MIQFFLQIVGETYLKELVLAPLNLGSIFSAWFRKEPCRTTRFFGGCMPVFLMSSALLLASLFVFPAQGQANSKEEQAEKILNQMDDMYRGDSSRGKLTMVVNTEHWNRTIRLEFFSKGEDKSLIRILSPKKEKGTTTLRVAEDMWNYLPKVKRVIKVPVSMMGGSWMGSHFTNDDLVKQSRMAEDFTYTLSFDGERNGQRVLEVTCIAKEDAAVVWGKIVVEVRSEDLLPLSTRFFDEDLELSRIMTFSDIRLFGKRKLPAVMTIRPQNKPSEYTQVRYEEVDFDASVADAIFSRRNLER